MKRNYYIVALIFVTFFVISFITNILGTLNPEVIKSFDLSLTMSGLLPFSFFIAYGLLSIPSGILVEKYKEKAIMTAAFVVAFIGALLFSLLPGYTTFLISLFLMGAGMAMLQVVINPLLRVAGGEEHFAFNSVAAQLVFGAASFLAPLFLAYLVASLNDPASENTVKHIFSGLVPASLPWASLYWVFALILIVMFLLVFFSPFPQVTRNEDEKAGSWQLHKNLFGQKVVILYFIGIFAYVGTEQGVSYWLTKFLSTYHGYDPLTIGASAVGWFWGLMSIGCLIGLFFLKLFDSRKVLVGAVILALIFLSAALFGPAGIALYAFPLVGFALSVMWSTIFSLALNSVESHHGSFAGVLCTAILGGAVIQLFIGWVGDHFGLRAGMSFVYIPLLYILSIGFWAKPIITNDTISLKKNKTAESEGVS